MTRTAPLLLFAVLALAGCAAPVATAPTRAPAPVVAEVPPPVAVTIPAIGVTSTLDDLGLDDDGTMAVPPITEPGQAGWYEPGVRPGGIGPAVVVGHVSGRPEGATTSVPGLFADLHELAPGGEVLVDRADATTAVFAVTRVQTHDKDAFPTEAVYGDTALPELRLITCGGTLGQAADGTRTFDSNVIVWATLVDTR